MWNVLVTSLTKRQYRAIKYLLYLVVGLNVLLAGFFSVLLRDYLHHKEVYLSYLEVKKAEISRLSLSLKNLEQRVSLLDVIQKRARGLSSEEHFALVDTLLEQQRLYNYSPSLLLALIQVESSFNNFAISHRGAIGLMQLQPETAEYLCPALGLDWEGPHSLFDPQLNIRLGCYYLSMLHHRFNDLEWALEAYNKGPTRVSSQLARGIKVRGVYSSDIDRFSTKFAESLGIS